MYTWFFCVQPVVSAELEIGVASTFVFLGERCRVKWKLISFLRRRQSRSDVARSRPSMHDDLPPCTIDFKVHH